MSIEFKAKRSTVWVGPNDLEVYLTKGSVYDWETKDKDGKRDELKLSVIKQLLKLDLIDLIDTKPIDSAYVRSL